MSLRVAVAAASLSLFASSSYAQKSVDECEAELNTKYGAGKYLRSEVSNCLLEASGSTPQAPRSKTIYVTNFGISEVNSVGGVEPFITFINPDPKSPVKYAVVTMALYNSVGDRVGSDIGGGSSRRLKYTGPLRYEAGEDASYWEPVWYNHSGSCVQITAIEIEHMNGRKLSLTGKALSQALATPEKNTCRVK